MSDPTTKIMTRLAALGVPVHDGHPQTLPTGPHLIVYVSGAVSIDRRYMAQACQHTQTVQILCVAASATGARRLWADVEHLLDGHQLDPGFCRASYAAPPLKDPNAQGLAWSLTGEIITTTPRSTP